MSGSRKERKPPTQERVRELFAVDMVTGVTTRKVTTSSNARAGDIVGSLAKKTGYLTVYVDGKLYYLHRIIWLHIHGYFPEHGIDHINRCGSDNSPTNLREVSPSCNARNSKNSISNTSGIKGVGWYKARNRWRAYIRLNGMTKHLGHFRCLTDAVAHRLAAEQALKWEGCDSSSSAFQYMQKYVRGEL